MTDPTVPTPTAPTAPTAPTPTATTQPTRWQQAEVAAITRVSPQLVSLQLSIPERLPHLPGQHYVVRLTAEDGYTAARSYSIASAPADDLLELCVERLDDGEVSGYLYDVVEPGDVLDVRGPIGGWFVWDTTTPALAIGGGSGVVPLVAMLRTAITTGTTARLELAVSGKTPTQLPYFTELSAAGATVALTASAESLERPTATAGARPLGRLTEADLKPLLRPDQTAYICGSTGFAESMSQALLRCGVTSDRIRVERFGPSG